jgi:hypothetical protein
MTSPLNFGTARSWCETHVSAALMHQQPASLDGERHARAVLGGASLVLEQERAVDQFDEDAPILRGLDGAGDLDDAARCLLGIGERAVGGVFHAAMCSRVGAALGLFGTMLVERQSPRAGSLRRGVRPKATKRR